MSLVLTVVFVLITGFGSAKAQELQPNVIIDESIGDTLDLAERNHFELFKTIEEFKWAIFFVDSDSTVYAKICFMENGKPKFTTYNYGPISDLRTRINKAPIYDRQAQIDKAQLYDKMRPWRSTVYLAIGFGNPQSPRYELGYNSKTVFAIAITYGKNKGKSDNYKEGTIGFLIKAHLSTLQSKITPYLLYNYSINGILGERNTYHLIFVGSMIPIKPWLTLRPEAGIARKSIYISGGRGFFGHTTSQAIFEKSNEFGFNLSFEIGLKRLLTK